MPTGTIEDTVQIGEWVVNPSLDTITKGTETHKLEPRTMRLLLCLATSAGEVVSVERLLNEVWTGVVVGSASVYQAVSQLRKLLGDADAEPTYIATVPRKGYRLIAAVRRVTEGGERPGSASGAEAFFAAPPTSAAASTPAKRSLLPILLAGAVLIALIASGVAFWMKTSTATRLAATPNSIVVLPFIDMTAEKADQSFCDGLTEELSSWLAQIPTLRVVARTSAFAFRGRDEDVRKIGRALDTSQILEGSMRRSGDRMRITVQLIDARNGYHLWSETFDRPAADAIKIQEDVSRSVAQTLKVRLTTDSERQFAARRTADSQAYQLYLLGRYYAQQLTAESTERAIDLFGQVQNADSKFAPVYIELAYARLNQGFFRNLPIATVTAQVEPLIAGALHLDDQMSSAYAARGILRLAQSRVGDGVDDLRHAIALNSNDMGAFAELGRLRLAEGRPREALEHYEHAAVLDPLNSVLQQQLCSVFQDLAQYLEAANACNRARVLRPETASTADGMAWLAASQGRLDEALRWNAASLKLEPHDDFELYWTRATLFLSVGLAAPARKAIELGRTLIKNNDDADVALLRVAYREGGTDALNRYLASSGVEKSPNATALFESAYARLLLGDARAVKELIARALVAPDRTIGFAEDPWSARAATPVNSSYRIDLAAAELALGDSLSAQRDLDTVLGMLDRMISAGVQRSGTYELRARVYALKGQGDDAVRDLGTAAKLGWRRAWWATHEPYFSSLWARSDFQAIVTRVNQSNEQLTVRIVED